MNEAKELSDTISKYHNDWNIIEEPPAPTPKKRGILALSDEDMREPKNTMKVKKESKLLS